MTPVLIAIVIMLVGFGLSAMYSGLETGVYVLNPVRLRLRSAAGRAAALRLSREVARPTVILTVLLIGNNAANQLGSYGMAELLGHAGLDGWGLVGVQIAVFTPLLMIFAETLPKELFRTQTDRWTYTLSPVLVATRWIVSPLLLLVLGVTAIARRIAGPGGDIAASERHRISQLLKEGVGAGVLSTAQTSLADRALAMRDRAVRAVMVPWREAWTISSDLDGDQRVQRVMARNFTRLPVTDRTGKVIGVVSWIDIMARRESPTSELLREPFIIDPATPVLEAMREMRNQGRALAVVQREGSARPVGIVTLKDLIEPLTGELAAW